MPDTSPTPVDLDAIDENLPAHYFDCGRFNVHHSFQTDPCDCTATADMGMLITEVRALRSRASIGPDSERIRELEAENARLRRLRDVGSCPCDCHDGPGPHCDTCCQKRPEMCHDCRSDT